VKARLLGPYPSVHLPSASQRRQEFRGEACFTAFSIGSLIVDKIQKIDGVFKTVTCLAVK
jgi:hypothetical protein